MSSYTEYFLNSNATVVQLETLEISHPSFSKVYRIVRNAMNGITAKLEDGVTMATFEYYPLQLKQTGSSDDLDQKLQIDLGDLGETIPTEIDNCFAAATMLTKPTVLYRVYRSDDLTQPLDGPFRYELTTLGQKIEGASFAAEAPRLNNSRTGDVYTLTRFPMLTGFL